MENEKQVEFRLNLTPLGFLHVHVPIENAFAHDTYCLQLLEPDLQTGRSAVFSVEAPVSELFQEVASQLEDRLLLAIRQAIREQRERARKHAAMAETLKTDGSDAREIKRIENYRDKALMLAHALEAVLDSFSRPETDEMS